MLKNKKKKKKCDRFGDVKIINGLPWGSTEFDKALSLAIRDKSKADKYGILYRPDKDRLQVFIGHIPVISDENNDIISEYVDAKEGSAGIWKLLTQKDISMEDNYSNIEIYKYLLLLKSADLKLYHSSNKAKIIGEYIIMHTEKDILDNNPKTGNLRLEPTDLEYYTKLSTKKTGKGIKSTKKIGKSDLPHELIRLVAAHKAGNTNTYNEINDTVDKLRRANIISVEDSKKIYKSLK